MSIPRQNPFPITSGDTVIGWQWYNEAGAVSKLYNSQYDALMGMLKYMKRLECGPTLWERIKDFWNDTGG